MFGKSMEHTIEDVYYAKVKVQSFKVFHRFVMNEMKLSSYLKEGVVTNMLSRVIILIEKKWKNMYIANLIIVRCDGLTFFSA